MPDDATQENPNLPAPADAEQVGQWTRHPFDDDAQWFRRFSVHTHRIRGLYNTAEVEVLGEQFGDGTASRMVAARSEHGELSLSPSDARELAAALLDAAERAERGSRQ